MDLQGPEKLYRNGGHENTRGLKAPKAAAFRVPSFKIICYYAEAPQYGPSMYGPLASEHKSFDV